MFKVFLIHGRVANFLMICSLIHLVKDNLSYLASSDNYRGIAIGLSSLIGLFYFLKSQTCDQLQFSYQKTASTTMCTWAISAVIEYYNKQGREVYSCAADLSLIHI